MTTSTDEHEIESNEEVTTIKTQINKKFEKYSEHKIKYVKTVNYGLVDEVVMTMVNPITKVVDSTVVSFYNK